MSGKIYKDDFGHEVRINIGIDLTYYQTITLYVTKPSGAEVTWVAISAHPTTKMATYTILDDDLDESGIYTIYGIVTYADLTTYTTEIDTIEVWDRGE